ncbi:MAG: hypothetical protein M1401_07965 [Chloroflexi bacterium]|nr:hypothetical protein [Chloroflexota bacterium]
MTEQRRCTATRRDGRPCAAQALPSEPYCWAHSPTLAEQRQRSRAKGGRNSAKAARLRKLTPPRLLPVFDRLETALDEVHTGALDPRAATAMAALARALATLLTAGELEERVRLLEQRTGGEQET